MVVTCENCSARYKLDDNRISGRGAKITCPRCRHVFVVYKDRPAAEAGGRVAVGGGVLQAPKPPPEAPPSPPTGVDAASAEAEVDALDFRKVGIQAWKVKVKIGLVYDFSDYRTLARYIAEGRVTASDKLSHDGTEWTEIHQIPDLAAHFVSVYRKLEAAQAAGADEEEEEDFEDDEPTNIMGMGGEAFEDSAAKAVALTSFSSSAASRILPSGGSDEADLKSAMSAALDAEGGGGGARSAPAGPRFIDPFEKRKSGQRRSKPQASGGSTSGARPKPRGRPTTQARSGESSGGGGLRMAAVALLVAAGAAGVWWYTSQPSSVAPAPTAAPTTNLAPGDGERTRKDIRADIEADILSGTEAVEVPDGDTPPEDEDVWGDDTPELIPVGPRGPTRTPSRSSSSPSSASTGPSAREHASAGDSAMQRRDYRGAVSSYRKAVGMEPNNSVYNGRLGAAMVRNGEMDAAMDPLMRAASAGYSPAFNTLGDLAASRGDTAGAIGYYQSYLATNPRDAQAVQAKIDRLSGS